MISRIKRSLQDYPGLVEKYKTEGLSTLNQIGQSAIKTPIQDMLNALAKRNVLNSSVVGDSMNKIVGPIADRILGYGTDVVNKTNAAGLLQPQLTIDAGRALSTSDSQNQSESLGRSNSVSNSSSGSVGSSNSINNSISGNTLAPYELLSNIFMGL
jgi:hypothetical protein